MAAEQQQRYPKGTYKLLLAPHLNGQLEFRLTNLCTKETVSSFTTWKFLKALDDDLTNSHYPQSSFKYRSWGGKEKMSECTPDDPKTFTSPSTNGPTFVIKVIYRQNATWQGSIQWIEGKQTQQFRSELEMLKLMDEAMRLTTGNSQDGDASWDL
jgi:hypothetical protein